MWMRILHDTTGGQFVAVVGDMLRLGGSPMLAAIPGALGPSLTALVGRRDGAPASARASAARDRAAPPGSPVARGDARQTRVEIVSRLEIARCRHWRRAFANQHKDRRYYEVVEDTIRQGFDYRYFAVKDTAGEVRAAQPFFLLDQDLVAGVSGTMRRPVDAIRRLWPRFMTLRTLMIGCAAGEGHVDARDDAAAADVASVLASAIKGHAREVGARLIVLKEFPAIYRDALQPFVTAGFVRLPSLPMVRLNISYGTFEAYMSKALSANMRRNLRKKFKAAARGPAIVMEQVGDIASVVDDVYPLYLQVFERSSLRFEKLSKDYLRALGRRMPDKIRFFVWRREGRIVAFAMCMVHRNTIFFEYLGLDYNIALKVHLYHLIIRDLLSWAMVRGYKWCVSTAVSYDPKYHLRFALAPLDLYVRHTSGVLNLAVKMFLPLVEPTRYDRTLRQFANYGDLWVKGPTSGSSAS